MGDLRVAANFFALTATLRSLALTVFFATTLVADFFAVVVRVGFTSFFFAAVFFVAGFFAALAGVLVFFLAFTGFFRV
jgi:hypothetical protein